jgi:AcrR family transcriptional regulator
LSIQTVSIQFTLYPWLVPKLWNETIEAHRRDVRDAILDTTVALVAEHGLRSTTMSRIAERTGIGRATLYKYFPDVESILIAWHHQHVAAHLEHLIRDVLADATTAGHVRDDIAPDELATYCLHALAAAGELPSETAVRRLVSLTLTGLRR